MSQHPKHCACDMPNEFLVDVLLDILEYVDKTDLPIICLLNKVYCSCSQDVLYRDIYVKTPRVQRTLARSTHLARRVRSFYSCLHNPDLATALRNMTSLRILKLPDPAGIDMDILAGCSFKLDTFECYYMNHRDQTSTKSAILGTSNELLYYSGGDLPTQFNSDQRLVFLPPIPHSRSSTERSHCERSYFA